MEDGVAIETEGINLEQVLSHLNESGDKTIHGVTMCIHTETRKYSYELIGNRAGACSTYIDLGPSCYATMHENSQKVKGKNTESS